MNLTATKKTNFQTDIQLERKFKRIIKAILGNQFIIQDRIEDIENGTDFLLFKISPFKIGVRLRRTENPQTGFVYYPKYKNEFTIRWKRPSGIKTEIHKIREGLVDYILYGFVDKEEKCIIQYFIGDLNVFRNTEATPVIKPNNNPLDSWLAIYNINQFPKEFILKWYEKN